jgi:hypothetical protein
LPDPQQSSLDLQLLENQSRERLKNVRDVAVVAGAGAFVAGVGVAASAGAGAVGAAMAVPLAVLTLPVLEYQMGAAAERRHVEHEDRSLIELTILERGLHLPLEVPAGEETPFSLENFFEQLY